MTGKSMPLRVRNTHNGPFPIPILERILHSHSIDDVGIVFGMKNHSRVRNVPVEGNRSCCDIQALQVEPGAGGEPVQNRSLYLLFILIGVPATRKYYDD
jgi:hypothetical protein